MERKASHVQTEKLKDVATHIYSTLRQEILNMEIKPGEEIVESDTCSRFNASRTPVREAFQNLQNSGLITTIPYKGSFASLLNYDEIQQVIYMRGIVEAAVVAEFTEQSSPYEIEELRYRLNLQRILLENDFDSFKFYEADSVFHAIWFVHQKKELLWEIIQKSQLQYSRFKMLDLNFKKSCEDIYAEHCKLFKLIEKKDSAGAALQIKMHLQGGVNRVGERLQQNYASYFL